jgi:acyl carrier protein
MSHVDTIKQFVLEEFLPDVSTHELGVDHDLLADGVIDSLGVLKLIAWVEDHFELAVDDTALDPNNFRSILAIDSFIKGSSKPATAGG